MNILHLDSEKTWRGGQNQIRLLMEGLEKMGVNSCLATPQNSSLAEKISPRFPTLQVAGMRSTSLMTALKIRNYCLAHSVDLIDAHSSNAHMVGLWVKKLGLRVPLVVHRRVDYMPGKSLFNLWKYKNPGIGRYIAISDKISGVLLEYGIARDTVSVAPSAVESGPYRDLCARAARKALVAELKIPEHYKIIGNVAALSPQKDHRTLIRAVRLLRKQSRNFCLFIAGAGPLADEIRSMIRDDDLGGHIRMLGFRSDVRSLLAGADIMVLSSRDEGLGTVIQEGIYAGCQIVCTDAGGIGEMVRHQKSAYMSPVRDPGGLSRNLLRALSDDETKRSAMVENARNFLRANYSVDRMVEKNLKVYHQLIGGSG